LASKRLTVVGIPLRRPGKHGADALESVLRAARTTTDQPNEFQLGSLQARLDCAASQGAWWVMEIEHGTNKDTPLFALGHGAEQADLALLRACKATK
jgi:hypothetical protein